MTALLRAFRRAGSGFAMPVRWAFPGDARAIGALMFEQADMVALSRRFTAAELAAYEHHFHGDMIMAPLTVQIGTVAGRPLLIAFNRRPGAPAPRLVAVFLSFALSRAGQAAIAAAPNAAPLEGAHAAVEAAKLAGFLAPLDAALSRYAPVAGLTGRISSVGSDGMKDLMDGWECRFHALHPGVGKGEHWEHLGTLNGFHALLAGVAEIAPMGRELWPEERAIWAGAFGTPPVEIAVARGGFNTPQRTTAQAIFVHPSNPLAHIRFDQLAAIFGEHPTITRWGQLGLTGTWADRSIHPRMPPHVAPNTMSMQITVLRGRAWNPDAVEAPVPATAAALASDPDAIGFGGLEEGAPGLKTLAVARAGSEDYVSLDAQTVSSGPYPLARYMYVRLAPGPIAPATASFLRFVLSRDGQERVRYSGYFPLSATEAARELAKLGTFAR